LEDRAWSWMWVGQLLLTYAVSGVLAQSMCTVEFVLRKDAVKAIALRNLDVNETEDIAAI
jgi:hypothetical protein